VPKRSPNHRQVKIHRSYTVEEVAILFGVHKNTVRQWIKAGLPALDDKRPTLIFGQELSTYLQARRARNKRPCRPGQLYCVRCRVPQYAAGGMADYLPETANVGMLKAICEGCHSIMNRRVSMAKLDGIRGDLAITFPLGLDQVSNRNQPTVNSDFREEGKA
jgi:excisionase family DNA binding protein